MQINKNSWIRENPRKSLKSLKKKKVLRERQASLESSKGFYKGAAGRTVPCWNVMTSDPRKTSDPLIESSSAGEVGGRGGSL